MPRPTEQLADGIATGGDRTLFIGPFSFLGKSKRKSPAPSATPKTEVIPPKIANLPGNSVLIPQPGVGALPFFATGATPGLQWKKVEWKEEDHRIWGAILTASGPDRGKSSPETGFALLKEMLGTGPLGLLGKGQWDRSGITLPPG
jgi:hypothetical protein